MPVSLPEAIRIALVYVRAVGKCTYLDSYLHGNTIVSGLHATYEAQTLEMCKQLICFCPKVAKCIYQRLLKVINMLIFLIHSTSRIYFRGVCRWILLLLNRAELFSLNLSRYAKLSSEATGSSY